MKKIRVGIVGASGLVGLTILDVLREEKLLTKVELVLITSEKNQGKEFIFENKTYKYLSLQKSLKMKFDAVFFSAGDEISKNYAYNYVQNGAVVIDNSNAFRKIADVPLVVPEINANLINEKTKIVANPNCSTIQLAIVLDRLLQLGKIDNLVVSTYQSVSGAGKLALDDLKNGTEKHFGFDIRNNIVPQIGALDQDGSCTEENKIMFEVQKILNQKISIFATAVRVPIPYCHGESVYLKFSQKIDKNSVKKVLKCDFIENFDEICLPTDCFNQNKTYICRLRQVSEHEIMFFVLADNLRRGAAYNAVMIFREFINKNHFKM